MDTNQIWTVAIYCVVSQLFKSGYAQNLIWADSLNEALDLSFAYSMTDFNVIDETRQWIVPTLFHSKIDIFFIDLRGEIQVSSSNIKTDNNACINIKYKNKKYKQSKKNIIQYMSI